MKDQRKSTLLMGLGLCLTMAALCAATAVADADPTSSVGMLGLGTGRDGDLTVTEPNTVINRYTQVSRPLAPGDTELFVSSAQEFGAGDLVMVLQTTGLVPEPARGSSVPIELTDNPVGRWELVRISSTTKEELRLEQPLRSSYAAAVTQVIRVPEYTRVTVLPGASIAAVPWNGGTGGVVALLAAGTLHNQGKIDASGAGFRAGSGAQDVSDSVGCASLPREVRPGAHRGEGIAMMGYGPVETGAENAANGGGGGLCPMAGGGGGGNGAAGGKGGDSQVAFDPESDLGGQGGARLLTPMLNHLLLGGGGGLGYGEVGVDSQGGAGGGVIFIRGQQITGEGVIIADGEAGKDGAGGGGGGAGGSIYVRVVDSLECGLLSAHGGAGGNAVTNPVASGGGGGGGGGGQVLYQARDVSCAIDAGAGLAGRSGAQPTQDTVTLHQGVITRLQSSRMLACPGNGSLPSLTIQNLSPAVNDTTPTFTIKLSSAVTNCAVTMNVDLDGTNAGTATSNGDGTNWTYTSTRVLGEGIHTAIATAGFPNGEARSSPLVTFRVDTTPPTTTLTVTPSNPTNDNTPTFEFTSDEQGTFKCQFDLAGPVSCTNPITLTTVEDGSHTFKVKAVDLATNEDATEEIYVWVTDTRRPNTTLTVTPPNPSNDSTPTFEFTSDEQGTFECSVDSTVYPNCTSPFTAPTLADGSHTFSVRAKDAATNVDASPASYTWMVDTTAPDTTLTSTPPNPSNNRTPSFSFSSSETTVTFECQVDTAAYVPCTNQFTTSTLPDGSHTFSVRAKDAATNVDSSPASYTWTVDTVPPDTTLAAPLPPNPSNNATATFTFSPSEAGNTLECSLDGAQYTLCTSPFTIPNLTDGSHTFKVRAKDAATNVDPSPPSYTWVVDTRDPSTTLTSTPPNPHNSTIATFGFTSDEAGSFECSLDSTEYSACTNPYTTPTLTEGTHTFSVRAKDVATNVDDTPANHTWVVDMTAPATTLTVTPPNPSNDSTPTFEFISNEPGTFECRVDSTTYSVCTSPYTTPTLTDGSHTFSVRAKDAATNVDASPASHSWVVDTAAPNTTLTSTPPNPTGNTSASFSFTSDEGGTFECKLDSATYSVCTSPAIFTGLPEGEHIFAVRAKDVAGNIDSTPASYTWRVDRSAPVIPTVLVPTEGAYIRDTTLRVRGEAEAGSEIKLRLNGTVVQTARTPSTGLWETDVDISALADGPHVLRAVSTDDAGNSSNSADRNFNVDRVPPAIQIESGPAEVSQERTATFTFSSSADLDHYKCDRSDDTQGFTLCSNPFSILNLQDGPYVLSVRAYDRAGNESSQTARHSWSVDNRPPMVTLEVPGNNGRVNVRRPRFSGTAEADTRFLEVFITDPQGASHSAGVTPVQDGVWSLESTFVVSNGAYSANAVATDRAGNTGQTPPVSFIVDTDPPDTEIVRGPPNPDNRRNVDFTVGSPENVSNYVCSLDETPVDCPVADCVEDGVARKCFTLNLTLVGTKRLEGQHTLKVSAKDGAGNIDPDPASYTWEVRIQPPPAPTITEPLEGAQVYDLAPTVGGVADVEGQVTCYQGNPGPEFGVGKTNGQGGWSLRPSRDLDEGDYTVYCEMTDKAENTSTTKANVTFTVHAPRPQAKAIGGGLGCVASGGAPWLALLGLLMGAAWRSRRRR